MFANIHWCSSKKAAGFAPSHHLNLLLIIIRFHLLDEQISSVHWNYSTLLIREFIYYSQSIRSSNFYDFLLFYPL